MDYRDERGDVVPSPATGLPPIPANTQALSFLRAIYGCFELDAIRRHVVKSVPELVGAGAARLCLREPGQAYRCWTVGNPASLRRPSRVHGDQTPSRPVTWRRRGREMQGHILLVGRCEAVLELRRLPDALPFTAHDEAWLAFALDHVSKAIERACRYTAARQSAQLLAAALEMVPWPVVVIDGQGAVLFRNQAAVPALSRGEIQPCQKAAMSALARLHCGGGADSVPVPVDSDCENGWQAHVVHLPDGVAAAILLQPGPPVAGPTLVGERLTDREREVAALVARGLTNSQIAAALSITVNTVKRHLKSAFRKQAVVSRAELVAHLLQG